MFKWIWKFFNLIQKFSPIQLILMTISELVSQFIKCNNDATTHGQPTAAGASQLAK